MKKGNFTKVIPWLAVIVMFSVSTLSLNDDIRTYVIPICTLLIIVVLAFAMHAVLKDLKYVKTKMDNGEYDELIKYMIDKDEGLNGKIGYKQQYILNIANCYNRMGNFNESLIYLETMDENVLDNHTKALYYALYSSNLYFLNQTLQKAKELIIKSKNLLDMPESILLQALIEIELNNKEGAIQLIEEYSKNATKEKYMFGFFTAIYIDKYSSEISENFMLGLFFMKIGEEEKAKCYFLKPANCHYKNYLSDLSKEFCEGYSL